MLVILDRSTERPGTNYKVSVLRIHMEKKQLVIVTYRKLDKRRNGKGEGTSMHSGLICTESDVYVI